MKVKKCSHIGCLEERFKRPGNNTLYFKFCQTHQISHVIGILNAESEKYRVGLQKFKETIKKGTPRQNFYRSTAWKHFSQYVLLFYADENLEVRCSTNPNLIYKITDKRICVGHFIKVFDSNSSNYSTAFLFTNVGPQSTQENLNGGNEIEMSKWIEKTHGKGTVEFLNNEKHKPFKLDKYTLDEIAKKYLNLKNELLKARNFTNPWK
jgi:hypothetical protein